MISDSYRERFSDDERISINNKRMVCMREMNKENNKMDNKDQVMSGS